jgi:hypothetical protein
VPAELDRVVLQAVAPDPDARVQSAATLSAELRAVQAILDVRGGTGEEDEEAVAGDRRGALSGLALALVLIALAAAVWLLF